MPLIQLALADDHQIVIDGLKLLLSGRKNLRIVAEANSGTGLLQLLGGQVVDVLVTDITMPEMDGYELSLRIKQEYPHIKILALSMSEDGATIARMIELAKVDGFIPKASGKQELINAIEQVAAGEIYFSPVVMEQYELYKKVKTESETFNLTARELQVIDCIARHMSNKEIAGTLFISERTVETHRKNIYRKTNTKGEATLIQFA
ncbi:MAG: response regulator transcription factor, partial [Bacteroidetes bacterium]|nr:response regulator transcription factor [Bacteroidota bacterium]